MSKIDENGLILKPHQILPAEFMRNHFGLILFHNVGSGKTLTSLNAMIQFRNPIIVIGTKSSKKAFIDEIAKIKLKRNIELYTFTKIYEILPKNPDFLVGKSVIVDEAHNLRNITSNNRRLWKALMASYKVLLLTATPFSNHMVDIAVLVNIVHKSRILPILKHKFDNMYGDVFSGKIKNGKQLEDILRNTISYYKTSGADYPTFEIHYKYVNMTPEQIRLYKKYIRKIIYLKTGERDYTDVGSDKWIEKWNEIGTKYELIESIRENSFFAAVRQISIAVNSDYSAPKISMVYKQLMKGKFPAVIFSNFIRNGIVSISRLLTLANIPHRIISGVTSSRNINKYVNEYNNGTIDVLLLSSAGAASLDLKKTRQIHIMDPFWNDALIHQVFGRGIRYKSHANLSKAERHVDIYRWISIFPRKQYPHFKGLSADEYLTRMSMKKLQMYSMYFKIIRNASIEHNKSSWLNKKPKRNTMY